MAWLDSYGKRHHRKEAAQHMRADRRRDAIEFEFRCALGGTHAGVSASAEKGTASAQIPHKTQARLDAVLSRAKQEK